MEGDIATGVHIRGQKRGAEPALSLPQPKRARPSPPLSDDSSATSDDEGISTPTTPGSILPSRQKRLACTWSNCTKAFSRPVHLAEHLNSHKGIRTHSCDQCDKTFLRKSHLQHHVKNAHTAVREYTCEWQGCDKAFSTGTRLRRHHATHTKREQYRCDRTECGQSFRKHATLQKHIATDHEGRSPFVCDKPTTTQGDENSTEDSVCGAGFPTANKLRLHQGRVHGVGRYWCTVCSNADGPLSFPTYSDFQVHNAEVHPPTCPTCSYIAVSSKDLRSHLKQQHDMDDSSLVTGIAAPPPARFQCDQVGCTKTFTRKANLSQHTKSVHDKRRFVCGEIPLSELNHVGSWDGSDACRKDFSAKGSLESHIRAAHLNLPNPQRRKAKEGNQKKPKRNQVSIAAKLAGTGYAEVDRPLACLVAGCAFRFVRAYDRAVHARAHHGLGETEIAALAAAAEVALVSAALAAEARVKVTMQPTAAVEKAASAMTTRQTNGNSVAEEIRDANDNEFEGELDEENDSNYEEYDEKEGSENENASAYEEELEQGALSGGVFWVGGSADREGNNRQKETDWQTSWEAEEMDQIVHGAEEDDEYDFTLEDEYRMRDYSDYDDYDQKDVTGTGGRVDMAFLG